MKMKRELCFGDFVENLLKADLHLDLYEPVSSKLSLVVTMTKLYIFIPV